MTTLSDNILNTIKGKNLKPKPRWHFIVRQVLIWFTALLSVVIGSFTFSVILFRMVNNDWEILTFINRSPFMHVFSTLPYIWILLLVLFVGLAYYNARHTKGAYKYQGYWFVIGSVILSLAIGGMLYAVGIGPLVHGVAQRLPVMRDLMHDREELWLTPENGLLAGEVTDILSGVGIYTVTDFNEGVWIIVPADDYMESPFFTIEEGVLIRMTGSVLDEDHFEAQRIMPYHMGPGMMKGKIPADYHSINGGRMFQFGR